MAGAVSIRTVWDRPAIAALKTDPEVVAYVEDAAQGLARDMRILAPKLTGAGAASIEGRESRAKGARDVGWDRQHYYMSILNNFSTLGKNLKPNAHYQFAQQALESYIHV